MTSLPGAAQAFSPDPSSVVAARRFLADQLHQWQREEVLWAALQAVSELATNCVLHANTSFTVGVQVLPDGAVRLEVSDDAVAAPRIRHYGLDATTGRGVGLVAGLARTWGVESRPLGKVVWCELQDEEPGRDAADDDNINLDMFLSAEDRAVAASEAGGPGVLAAAITPCGLCFRGGPARVAA